MTTARPSPAPIAKLPWHKLVIRDITHEYYRPNAEQADARHREVEKHWQQQRQRRAEETPEKPEDLRLAHLRWRELVRLLRYRYGFELPDTDEARRDLEILLCYASLTGKKPSHQAELWAPWLDEDELDHMAAHQRPILHKADDIGHKLDLLYCDRQRLAIRTIGSTDVDQDERERLRRERCNEAKRQKRAAAKQEEPMQTATAPDLKPKERKVLARIDGEIAVPELTKRVARLKEFQKLAKPRDEVHRVLDHLKALGLVTDRYAPGPRGGRQSRYVMASAMIVCRT